jgi:hypothetical protein
MIFTKHRNHLNNKMENKNICDKCYMSKESEYFWEAHQTMQDGNIWCVNAKRA